MIPALEYAELRSEDIVSRFQRDVCVAVCPLRYRMRSSGRHLLCCQRRAGYSNFISSPPSRASSWQRAHELTLGNTGSTHRLAREIEGPA